MKTTISDNNDFKCKSELLSNMYKFSDSVYPDYDLMHYIFESYMNDQLGYMLFRNRKLEYTKIMEASCKAFKVKFIANFSKYLHTLYHSITANFVDQCTFGNNNSKYLEEFISKNCACIMEIIHAYLDYLILDLGSDIKLDADLTPACLQIAEDLLRWQLKSKCKRCYKCLNA